MLRRVLCLGRLVLWFALRGLTLGRLGRPRRLLVSGVLLLADVFLLSGVWLLLVLGLSGLLVSLVRLLAVLLLIRWLAWLDRGVMPLAWLPRQFEITASCRVL